MKKCLLLLPAVVMLLIGCEKAENFPKAASSGGSGSTGTGTKASTDAITLAATDWFFNVGNVGSQNNTNNYRSSLTTSAPSPIGTGLGGVVTKSPSYSLGIAATTIVDTSSFSYWTCPIMNAIPLKVGKSLTLKAKVRLENIQGKGISLVLRGDKGTQTGYLFATTEGKTAIKGTADFTDYSVTLPYTSPVDQVLIYLVMLPRTTGTVIFSDVSVQVN